MNALQHSLARATRAHPLERRLLLCRSMAQGRELLRALSLSGTSWLGWEITTLPLLARVVVHETCTSGASYSGEG